MNLRTLIVKTLYPLCSDEVQILIDQMKSSPSKFAEMFEEYRPAHPWAKALSSGNFELFDHVALRQQLKLLKGAHAKQLILEGLLTPSSTNKGLDDLLKDWTDEQVAKSQPSKTRMNRAQLDIAKKFAKAEFDKNYVKYNTENRYTK